MKYNCYNCDAEFKLRHDMDEDYYEVNFCPFCGSSIEEEQDEVEDDE